MENLNTKIETADVLFEEYDWFKKLFPIALQKSTDCFFQPGLRCELIGVSRNINLLQHKEAYYVTKIKLDALYDMYLRMSEGAVALLLNKGLGRTGRIFNINKLTEIESSVLTGFNDYVSRIVVQFLEPPPVVNFVRINYDITHLTFIIRDDMARATGKFIISVPNGRLSPKKIENTGDKFETSDFYKCNTVARIKIGKTRFTVRELKDLEVGDLVVLEDSNLESLTLYIRDEVRTILIEPNMEIEIPFDENNGGDEMGNEAAPNNLWDSIEVDMYAELNPVKISLGNLKKIEEGLVVDVAALYDNKVTLRVENKVIGIGELVIVNDRYGVKIHTINRDNDDEFGDTLATQDNSTGDEEYDETSEDSSAGVEAGTPDAAQEVNDEDFDYSDFELEDEDI